MIDDGSTVDGDAVIVTTPLPQAFSLLVDSGIDLDEAMIRTDYDRTIALLATLDGTPEVPAPGGVQGPNPDIGFVADNQAKGVSAAPAITVHASASWSEAHWDDDLDDLRTPAARVVQPLDRRGRGRRSAGEEVAIRHAAVAMAGSVLGGSRRHDRVGRRCLRRPPRRGSPQLRPGRRSRPRRLTDSTRAAVSRRLRRRSAPW